MFAGRVEARFTIPSGQAISATNVGGGPTAVAITPGTYYHATFATAFAAMLNAQRPGAGATWTVTYSTTTGQYTIAMLTGGAELFSIAWTSTSLRDLMGFTADVVSQVTETGDDHARGLWLPDCVFRCDADARRAPLQTDHRNTLSPTGVVYGLKSNKMYRLANPRWMHVPSERTWEADATLNNASYEQFVLDTQLKEGHAWFSLSSKIKIYDHAGNVVGADANANGVEWQVPSLPGLDTIRMSDGIENGLYYQVAWPELVGSI